MKVSHYWSRATNTLSVFSSYLFYLFLLNQNICYETLQRFKLPERTGYQISLNQPRKLWIRCTQGAIACIGNNLMGRKNLIESENPCPRHRSINWYVMLLLACPVPRILHFHLMWHTFIWGLQSTCLLLPQCPHPGSVHNPTWSSLQQGNSQAQVHKVHAPVFNSLQKRQTAPFSDTLPLFCQTHCCSVRCAMSFKASEYVTPSWSLQGGFQHSTRWW